MSHLDEIRKERLDKIEVLRQAGMEAYPAQTVRTHTIAEFLKNHQVLDEQDEVVGLAGRIFSIRDQGGVMFVDLFDGTEKTQLVLQAEQLGEDMLTLFRNAVDSSDVIEAHGEAFTTKRGMPSLQVSKWRMLAKSLQPVPDQWYGLKDEDERYRKRYIDILLSKDIADRIRRRSAFWNAARTYLLERDFVEVETPVLETTTGGADARPFETHHNALDIPVYLRISAGELWQKRLIVAGLPKVFEIGRIFRNEGMSAEHLQDYTQLEYYEAFNDYRKGMDAITDLYRTIAQKVYGTQKFSIKGFDIDLADEWKVYDYCELIRSEFGIDPLTATEEDARAKLTEKGIVFDPKGFNLERGIDLLWKQLRKSLAGPGFLIGVPAYM
ncbi:MAG: Lysine--tRNA ligase, partial [Parcubacteria group bacterium]|nr:Lysine--tRNA ligase [Parcubacteria group bacterium]